MLSWCKCNESSTWKVKIERQELWYLNETTSWPFGSFIVREEAQKPISRGISSHHERGSSKRLQIVAQGNQKVLRRRHLDADRVGLRDTPEVSREPPRDLRGWDSETARRSSGGLPFHLQYDRSGQAYFSRRLWYSSFLFWDSFSVFLTTNLTIGQSDIEFEMNAWQPTCLIKCFTQNFPLFIYWKLVGS